MTAIRAVVLAIVLLLSYATAEARVIAILFDDSGSMNKRIQLPAFAAQLLVSTLDGRKNEDRVIAARMSQISGNNSIENLDIATTAQAQATIDRLAKEWPKNPIGATPYQQIELLIQAIVETQNAGEEAYFIILTDGEFNDGDRNSANPPPPAAVIAARFEALKSQLKGPLRAEFVLIGASDSKRDDQGNIVSVKDLVANQGIRAALLNVFNGDSSIGSHEVSSATELIETVKDIVALVASTDRKAQDRFLSKSGNSMFVDTPLSVKRLVTVSTAPEGLSPARPTTPAFAVPSRAEISSGMLAADEREGWNDPKLTGLTTHFIFEPRLPPGKYEVPFDQIPDGVFLLFQTAAGLKLSLRDSNGNEFPELNGRIQVGMNMPMQAVIEVVDEIDGHAVTVPLSKLGDAAKLLAQRKFNGEFLKLQPLPAPAGDVATAEIATEQLGTGSIEATLQIDGFVSTYAKPVEYEVVNVEAKLNIAIKGTEDCAVCAADEIRFSVSPSVAKKKIATVIIAVDSPDDGQMELALEDSTGRLALLAPRGNSAQVLQVAKGPNNISVDIEADGTGDVLQLINSSDTGFTIRARMTGGLIGENSVSAKVRVVPSEARIALTSTSQDASGKEILKLDYNALKNANETMTFTLFESLSGAAEGEIVIEADSYVVDFVPSLTDKGIILTPQVAWWCGCLVFLDRGNNNISLNWTGQSGIQQAKAKTSIAVEVDLRDWSWACFILVLYLALFAYLLLAAWVWYKANRFPAASGISVYTSKLDEPAFRHLRHWDWTPFKALFFPYFKIPHEVRVVEGVTLRAARTGAEILVRESPDNLRVENHNQTLAQMKADRPSLQSVKMNWNDMVERRDGGLRRLTLLRRAEDRGIT